MKYSFVKEEHELYGGEGWKLLGRDFAEPFGELAAIHDIMEHFPNWEGDEVEGELQALGAAFYVRRYYWQLMGYLDDIPKHIGGELKSIFDYLNNQGESFSDSLLNKYPPRTKKLDDEWLESQLRKTAEEMVSDDAWDMWDEDNRKPWEPEEEKCLKENIVYWFRKGYRKAAKRYHYRDSYTLSQVYVRMERELILYRDAELGERVDIYFTAKEPHKYKMIHRNWEEKKDENNN